jgi:hypothetical protein
MRVSTVALWLLGAACAIGVGCERGSGASGSSATSTSGVAPAAHTAPDRRASTSGEGGARPGSVPVDFPRRERLELSAGQHVLGADRHSLDRAREGDDEMILLSYVHYRVVEPGRWTSKVERRSETHELPNALLIPLGVDDAEAIEPGAMVLTPSPQGGGLHRAVVLGVESPGSPRVRFLDLPDTPPADGPTGRLAPGSFRVLDEPFEPGARTVYRREGRQRHGVVLAATERSLLVLEGESTLRAVPRDDARAAPMRPSFSEGDAVHVVRNGQFFEGRVLEVLEERGAVRARYDRYGEPETGLFVAGDVTKSLPAPDAP